MTIKWNSPINELKTRTRLQQEGNEKDGNKKGGEWRQTIRYHMAKRFHLSMPLFVLPFTVEVTHYDHTVD